jgi:hypothetical protein
VTKSFTYIIIFVINIIIIIIIIKTVWNYLSAHGTDSMAHPLKQQQIMTVQEPEQYKAQRFFKQKLKKELKSCC